MRVEEFNFDLPTDRIALRPARPRDSARMLLVEGERLSDRGVLDLPSILRPGDVLVFGCGSSLSELIEAVRPESPEIAERLIVETT